MKTTFADEEDDVTLDWVDDTPKSSAIIRLGLGVKIAFDEDGDAQWWHMGRGHKGWQWLDITGYHKPSSGGWDDIDHITIPKPIICSLSGCRKVGYITNSKWIPSNENTPSN